MSNTVASPNMSLPVPVVGVESGPEWATDLNNCLSAIDSHDHSAGSGVQITPDGISINSDLPFNNSNAISLRSSRYTVQLSSPADTGDIGCTYVLGVDLYYKDINGNVIQITQSGGVAGSPGSISNLTSPASAAYVAANETFVWQSNTNIAATMDMRNAILRNSSASSFGLTLSPPTAMGADIAQKLPTIPAATKIMTMDSSGNMGTTYDVDNSTLQVSSSVISVKDAGVTQAKLQAVSTGTTATAGNMAVSSSSGSFSSSSTSTVDVTNLSVTLTTTGRPVQLWIQQDGSGSNGTIGAQQNAAGTLTSVSFNFARAGSSLGKYLIESFPASGTSGSVKLPPSSLRHVDVVAAGTYAYKLQAIANNATSTIIVSNCKLYAKEM